MATLERLEEYLAEQLAGDSLASTPDVLAAVVIGYRADTCWLLTGDEQPHLAGLPAAVRLRLSNLMLAIGDRLLAQHRARRREAATARYA